MCLLGGLYGITLPVHSVNKMETGSWQKSNIWGTKPLKLMNNYLSQANQSAKINESSSSWEQIIFGVPQSSVLRPILSNIFLNDLYLILSDINYTNDANDITLHKNCNKVDVVVNTFRISVKKLIKWQHM